MRLRWLSIVSSLFVLGLVASACASTATDTELAASSEMAIAVDGSEVSLAPEGAPRLLWFWGPF